MTLNLNMRKYIREYGASFNIPKYSLCFIVFVSTVLRDRRCHRYIMHIYSSSNVTSIVYMHFLAVNDSYIVLETDRNRNEAESSTGNVVSAENETEAEFNTSLRPKPKPL